MRKKQSIPKNHIAELLKERDMNDSELAKKLKISASYMSKLVNHQARVTPELAHQIAQELGTDPHKVVDMPFAKKFTATCDEGLLGSAIGWLLEAAKTHKIKLIDQELSHWASYVYKNALEEKLNFNQTKFLAHAIIDVIRQVKG